MKFLYRVINVSCLVSLLLMNGCGAAESNIIDEPTKVVETGQTDKALVVLAPEKTAAQKEPVVEDKPVRISQALEDKQTRPPQPRVAKQQTTDLSQTPDKQVKDPNRASDPKQTVQQQTTEPNQVAAVEQFEEEPEIPQSEDENRVLVKIDGEELTAWQAKQLMDYGFSMELLETVQRWIDVKTRAAEARRLGLDKTRESIFSLNFRVEFQLAEQILSDKIKAEMPEPNEEEIRQLYDRNINVYQRPMNADIQHICVLQKSLAEQIAAAAKEPGASFDELVEKYSRGKDKATQGRLYGVTYEYLEKELGPRVAEEASKVSSRETPVLGPIMGLNGFEVIKVHMMKPGFNTPFEEIRDDLKQSVANEKFRMENERIGEELKKKVKIEKSQEILKLEAEAAQKKPPEVIKG